MGESNFTSWIAPLRCTPCDGGLALDPLEQEPQAAAAELGEVLADGRERRREVGRLGDVVEPDHRDVARDLPAGLVEASQQAERHLVVGDEHGGQLGDLEQAAPEIVSGPRGPVAAAAESARARTIGVYSPPASSSTSFLSTATVASQSRFLMAYE